jgi:hypothetical protein
LSKLKTDAGAGVVAWWRRRTADSAMRVPLRRTGAVSSGVLIGSLVLARVIAPTGSRLLLALMFIVFVGAGVTLFAVVIAWCQASGDEIETADPGRVTNRGVIAGTARPRWRNAAAGAACHSRLAVFGGVDRDRAGVSARSDGRCAPTGRTRGTRSRWVSPLRSP